MSGYIPLSQSFQPAAPGALEEQVQGAQQQQQAIQKGKIALSEFARMATQDALVRDTVKQHTTADPSTGQVATDQKGVLRDLYLKDPDAAAKYQTHVEDMQAERAQKQAQAAKAQQDTQSMYAKQIQDTLAAVDETGDQAQAKADYDKGYAELKAAGNPLLQPGDEMYSAGKVAYLKRKAVGPVELQKEGNAADIAAGKQKSAMDIVNVKVQSASDLEDKKAKTTLAAAQIAAQSRLAAAGIGANATITAAKMRAAKNDAEQPDKLVDMLADSYIVKGTLPALGQGQGELRKAALNRAAEKMAGAGLSAADIAAKEANFKANSSSLRNQTTQADNLQGNIQAMSDNLDNFIDLSGKIPNQSKYPLINSAKMLYRDKVSGDPQVREMLAAHGTALREYAKITSGNPSGAGVLSDSARHEALDTINGSAPLAQKIAAAELIKTDAANVVKAKQAQAAKAAARIAGSGFTNNAPPNVVRTLRLKGRDGLFDQLADGSLVPHKGN